MSNETAVRLAGNLIDLGWQVVVLWKRGGIADDWCVSAVDPAERKRHDFVELKGAALNLNRSHKAGV